MFDSTRLPVTVYRSGDEGAPRLGGAGSLKTVLKACLVTGYGGKAALGWAMPFEDAHSAAFQSQDAQSKRHFFKVDNSNNGYGLAYCYRQMTALNQGEGYFGYNEGFRYLPYEGERPWILVGHSRAFTLILQSRNNNGSGMCFFGDFPSLVPADGGNTAWLHGFRNYDSFYLNGLRFLNWSGSNTVSLAMRWDGVEAAADGVLHSLGASGTGIPYPDPIGGGLLAGEIYLYEKHGYKHLMRGLLPGWYKVQHDLNALPEAAALKLESSDDAFLKFNLDTGSEHAYLLNISAWEA